MKDCDCSNAYGTRAQGVNVTRCERLGAVGCTMTAKVDPGRFANGFDYFCPDCPESVAESVFDELHITESGGAA